MTSRAPVAALALPAVSPSGEKRVLGHLNNLALRLDTFVASFTLPAVSEVDVGMSWHGSGIICQTERREQTDPERDEEAKGSQGGSTGLRIALVHHSLFAGALRLRDESTLRGNFRQTLDIASDEYLFPQAKECQRLAPRTRRKVEHDMAPVGACQGCEVRPHVTRVLEASRRCHLGCAALEVGRILSLRMMCRFLWCRSWRFLMQHQSNARQARRPGLTSRETHRDDEPCSRYYVRDGRELTPSRFRSSFHWN